MSQERDQFDCVMLFSDISKKKWRGEYLNKIKEEDIYDDENGEFGLEDEPHITLLFGIHPDEVDRELAEAMVKSISKIELKADKISIFENDDFDVVKLDIIPSETLLQLRKMFINTLPNTQTFPDYKPHMTISYVKKGEGKKYKEKFKEPVKFTFNKGVYSDYEFNKKFFKLKELNESLAGMYDDIENAIKLNKKGVKRSEDSKNDLRNYVKKEFNKIKTFKQFKNDEN